MPIWTIMVYFSGDNNLSEEMIFAIKEIYRIGVNENFNVFIKFDPSAIGSKIYNFVLSKHRKAQGFTTLNRNKIIPSYSNDELFEKMAELDDISRDENFTSPSCLTRFIIESISKSPSQFYMLILSGHGDGITGDFLTDFAPGYGDQQEPGSLSLSGLKRAIVNAFRNEKVRKNCPKRNIDILGLDSCLMCMAEVAYQVKNHISFVVGAEGNELNTGWPYHKLLKNFKTGFAKMAKDKWVMKPQEVAKRIVRDYVTYYHDYEITGLSTDQAALDLNTNNWKNLMAAIRDLAIRMTQTVDCDNQILLAHWRAQTYNDDQYVDLWDFCNLLKSSDPPVSAEIQSACQRIKKIIQGKEGIVLLSGYNGKDFQHSHGVSIYFPWKDSEFLKTDSTRRNRVDEIIPCAIYQNLDFARKANGSPQEWVIFLREFVKRTQRKCRGQNQSNGQLLFELKEEDKKKFKAPDYALILVRQNPKGSTKGVANEIGSMKNPPDGYYRWTKELSVKGL